MAAAAPLPAALLFDLDGTLVDSRHDIVNACNAALVAHGRAARPFDEIVRFIGDGARALVARAFDLAEAAPLVSEALATFQERYLEAPHARTVLLPGAREILEEARHARVPCAVVTNKPRAVTIAVLEGLGIATMIDAVRAGGDGMLKPSPEGLVAIMRTLGVPPSATWMIGDGPQDVRAGKAAGCFTVAVSGIAERAHVLESDPDLVVDSLNDVRALLAEITARSA